MTMTICHTAVVASFSDRLKAARKRRGWTQEQLAEKAGVSYATIRAWESKDNPPVGSRMLPRVEHLLGVSFDDLTADADTTPGAPHSSGPTEDGDLRQVPEAMLVAELSRISAELSRRLAMRGVRHDQTNAETIGVKGLPVSSDEAEIEDETGPA